MKRILIVALVLLGAFSFSASAEDSLYKNQLDAAGFESAADALPEQVREELSGLEEGLYGGNPEIKSGHIFGIVSDFFKTGFSSVKTAFVLIIGVLLLWGIFDCLSDNTALEGVHTAFSLILTLTAVVPALKLCTAAAEAIRYTGVFMLSFVPVFGGIMASGGSTATASASGGMLLFAAEGAVQIIAFLIVPLSTAQLCLELSSAVSDVSPGSRLAAGIKKGTGYGLTLTFTVFLGLLSVQTAITSASDTVGMKTVKFMVGSFVPVAGTALSEVVSTLGSSVKILQTGTGVYGIVAVAAIMLPVVLELAVWRLCLNLSGVAADMLLKNKKVSAFSALDGVFSMLLGAVLFIAALFIISLAVLLKAGGRA